MCMCGGVIEVGILGAIGLALVAAWRWMARKLRR